MIQFNTLSIFVDVQLLAVAVPVDWEGENMKLFSKV